MLPLSLQKLIDAFSKLPGVGRKTAQRYAYFLLRSHRSLSRDMGETLLCLQDEITLCSECFMIADRKKLCAICSNPRRDQHVLCVVEHIFDAEAIEKSGEYKGLYHILHGRIAPLDEIGSEDIKIAELLTRVKKHQSSNGKLEIILATNPSTEGETTAMYIQKLLKPLDVKTTRIATGIPVGADLEYADPLTLGRAMKGRQVYE